MATTIDNSINKEILVGTDKIPIGDNTGDPKHYTPDQIKEHALKDILVDGGDA